MISGSATTEDKDMGMDDVIRRLQADASHVDVGIHSDEDEKLIVIAAANEFGATINHPGGTAYGYATPEGERKHQVRFLKGGTGYKVLGVTKPHTITIPARSYIRSTMDEKEGVYHSSARKLLNQIIDGGMTKYDALDLMGQKIEGDIKRKTITLRSPPNAPSTIRKKGSENPLVNQGFLGGSVRFVVKSGGDE